MNNEEQKKSIFQSEEYREYQRQYREANRERIRTQHREYMRRYRELEKANKNNSKKEN